MGSCQTQQGDNQTSGSPGGFKPILTGNRPPSDGDFEERSTMILGLNPKTLRVSRPWRIFLWRSKKHWAIVLQPEGEAFYARLVDDVLRNPTHTQQIEVASSRLFLVFELLTYRGHNFKEEFYLQVGAKPDFDILHSDVTNLGKVGAHTFQQLVDKAAGVVRQYRRYGVIGCNCQHFVVEFAQALGVERDLKTEDEAAASSLTEGGIGIATAGTATAGIAGTASALTVSTGSAAPIMLGLFGLGAGIIGLLGATIVVAASGGYEELKASHRRPAPKADVTITDSDGQGSSSSSSSPPASSTSSSSPPLQQNETPQAEVETSTCKGSA